jgi:hypothetical protein
MSREEGEQVHGHSNVLDTSINSVV